MNHWSLPCVHGGADGAGNPRAISFLTPLQGLGVTGGSGSLMFLRGHYNEQELVPSQELMEVIAMTRDCYSGLDNFFQSSLCVTGTFSSLPAQKQLQMLRI